MTPQVLLFNQLISSLTIAGQLFVVLMIFSAIFRRTGIFKAVLTFIERHALLLGGIVALTATFGSLYYSEIAGFTPCELCWFQRIFMYPQALLLLMAAWYQERSFAKYSLALSIIGALIAGYHYYGQMFNSSVLPCAVIGMTPSCSERFFVEYGYITIPMMSFTAFAMIMTLMLVQLTSQKKS